MTTTRRGNSIRIPDGYMTARQLAEKVKRSKDTVDRWRHMGVLPCTVMYAGKVPVYLFDDESLGIARQLARRKEYRVADRSDAAA